MKKKIMQIFILFLFISVGNVKAIDSTCSYSDQAKLNEAFSKVDIKYSNVTRYFDEQTGKQVEEDEVDESKLQKNETNTKYGYIIANNFVISILNATDLLDVEVTNNVNTTVERFDKKFINRENIIEFEPDNTLIANVVEYTFVFYASDQTPCAGDKVGTKRITTPRFNDRSNSRMCVENPEVEACQEWVFFDDEGAETLTNRIDEQIKNIEKKESEKTPSKSTIFDFIDRYRNIILISVVVIGIAVTSGVVINKIQYRRRGF